MKLNNFEELTQYMSPDSLIYWQKETEILAISQINYAPDHSNILLVPGHYAMRLSQLTTRLREMSNNTQLFSETCQPIFGFHLDLTHDKPYIILK